MHRLCLLLLLLWPLYATGARPDTLSASRLPYTLDRPVPHQQGDNAAWALPGFDDAAWIATNPAALRRQPAASTSGAHWWRLPIVTDSTLAGRSLAISLSQSGSCDVYLDGKLMHRFDEAPDKDSTTTPGGQPFVFAAPAPGLHLVAFRSRLNTAGTRRVGFEASIQDANIAVNDDRDQIGNGAAVMMTLFGIFLTFCILHLLMFFYYRAAKSNLWFAVFSLSLALLFGLFGLRILREDWMSPTVSGKVILMLVLLAGFSLSGLVNNLFFSRRNLWIRILLLAVVVLAMVLPPVFGTRLGSRVVILCIAAAALEAVVAMLIAVWRKRPGARIIASGMLLFLLLLLAVFCMATILGGFAKIALDGVLAIIVVLLVAIAILSVPLSMSAYLAWNFATMHRNMAWQLKEVERLSEETRKQEAERQRLLENRQEELEREVALRTEELRGQKQKSDDLLLNILPAEVAEELKEHGVAAARKYNDVSVLFTDFVDFTQHAEQVEPEALIAELHACFQAFDIIIGKHGLEKIKTVGDAYIAVCGLPAANSDHAAATVQAALDILAFMHARIEDHPGSFHIRLGIHSGPVIAGIVGVKKFAYDIWGDTVNTAARMEQHGGPGKVNISAATYALVKDRFGCTYRGELEVKHKGKMGMYFVGRGT